MSAPDAMDVALVAFHRAAAELMLAAGGAEALVVLLRDLADHMEQCKRALGMWDEQRAAAAAAQWVAR